MSESMRASVVEGNTVYTCPCGASRSTAEEGMDDWMREHGPHSDGTAVVVPAGPPDETDYYGEFWGAIRAELKVEEARKCLELLSARLPKSGREALARIFADLQILSDAVSKERARTHAAYEESVRRLTGVN